MNLNSRIERGQGLARALRLPINIPKENGGVALSNQTSVALARQLVNSEG
jgi:hypothetical protein